MYLSLLCLGLGRALRMYLLVGVGCFVYLISATYGLPLLAYSMTSHPSEESVLSGVNIFWLHKSVSDGLHFHRAVALRASTVPSPPCIIIYTYVLLYPLTTPQQQHATTWAKEYRQGWNILHVDHCIVSWLALFPGSFSYCNLEYWPCALIIMKPDIKPHNYSTSFDQIVQALSRSRLSRFCPLYYAG